MKKFIVGILFALMLMPLFSLSNTEAQKEVRQIIYAVKPVEKVRTISNEHLQELFNYVLENPENLLSENDQGLGMYLFMYEKMRRQKSPDEFSLFLQDEIESLPRLQKENGMPESFAIKIQGWIDLFKLNLIFEN